MSWAELFQFQVSPVELMVRGTLIYWVLYLGFRVVLRRDTGAIGIADVLLIVLIADAAQNGMSGDYRSISEAVVLISTLLFWNVAFDYLSFRFTWLQKILESPPLPLIEHGRVLHRNMRREFMTMSELMAKLREHGIEDVSLVKRCTMESDGQVTVILESGLPTKAAMAKSAATGAH